MLQKDDVDIPKERLPRVLKVKPVKDKEPMALRILTQDEKVKLIYIVGEGQIIQSSKCNVFESVLTLLACYYDFDLNYPAICGQLLGFIQQTILEEPYTSFKGTNFQTFTTKFKSVQLPGV